MSPALGRRNPALVPEVTGFGTWILRQFLVSVTVFGAFQLLFRDDCVSASAQEPREGEAAEQACLRFSLSCGPCERGEGVLGFQTGSSEGCMCAQHRPRIILSLPMPH